VVWRDSNSRRIGAANAARVAPTFAYYLGKLRESAAGKEIRQHQKRAHTSFWIFPDEFGVKIIRLQVLAALRFVPEVIYELSTDCFIF
jgi:hypothetical protein